jgi:hypothetical protein
MANIYIASLLTLAQIWSVLGERLNGHDNQGMGLTCHEGSQVAYCSEL